MRRVAGAPVVAAAAARAAVALAASAAVHWGAWHAVATGRPAPAVVAGPPSPVQVVAIVPQPAAPAAGDPAVGARPDPAGRPIAVAGGGATRRAPDAVHRADEPVWLEAWQVDEPPQFLVPPADLDGLPARVARRITARVSIRVDAAGRLAALDAEVPDDDPALVRTIVDALAEAFADVAFLPARVGGRAVPAVQRWSVDLDPQAPIALGFTLLN